MIVLTRRAQFCAAQADWIPDLSRAQNEAIFGTAATPEPYGHNYRIDVSVGGEIDPQTGILVNIKEIDRVVKQQVVHTLDRKFINGQIPEFRNRPVTPEHLALFAADRIGPHLADGVRLVRVRLEATPDLWAEWIGLDRERFHQEVGAMLMTRCYEFSASHRLDSPALTPEQNRELFGKCNFANGHGHNYELEVTVSGPIDQRTSRVVDPAAIDAIVNAQVVERYDHRHLNLDIPEFRAVIPSGEGIVKVIWGRLQPHIPAPARLHRIVLRETARNFFEYYGEDETQR
jgi:6-pyruvoyltetrahydropterin/6-carboxytetrahydropterin synthase